MAEIKICRLPRALTASVFLCLIVAAGFQTMQSGALELTIVDGDSGLPTPARIELLDNDAKEYIADDALLTGGDCSHCSGQRECPELSPAILEELPVRQSKAITNNYTRTNQFYSTGKSRFASLPAGSYALRVYKGLEFNVAERRFRIGSGEDLKITVPLSRWINLEQQGWYSADHHLHIPRPVTALNPSLSKWMQAEDVRVANLLQLGESTEFRSSPQYAFGKQSWYREGDYLLATGQENPRTDFRGHGIILGGNSAVNFPNAYLIYSKFWGEAKRQGALNGYAHLGVAVGATYGLAIDLPSLVFWSFWRSYSSPSGSSGGHGTKS